MKDLKEKVDVWNEKVGRLNDRYVKIASCNHEMIYMFCGKPYPIKSMKVLVDTGEGFKLHYTYDVDTGVKSEFSFGTIIKDKKAMIIDDDKFGIYAFGLDKLPENSPVKTMMIHIRTRSFHSLIMADTTSNNVVVMEELTLLNISASDAVSVCFSKIVDQLEKSCGGTDGI